MNDPQALIDSIRAAIEIPESVSPDRLYGLAREYADGCAQINSRLEECSRFLRVGNPCEAVRLAESAPDLLETCNVIDFPDRDSWNMICKSQNLPVAPALTVSIITQLNDSYNIVYGLDNLLRDHRRLALARAPLRDRLAVLYKLFEKEPENILWSDMITKLEEARFEEMNREYDQAFSGKENATVLVELLRELDSTHWYTTPPTGLVTGLRRWAKKALERRHLQEFRVLAENLRQALVDNDIPRAKHWQEQWQAKLKTSKIPITALPEDIRTMESEASSKLAKIEEKKRAGQRFQQELRKFQLALVNGTDCDQLEEAFNTLQLIAEKTGSEIPLELHKAYYTTVTTKRKKTARFRYLLIGGICLGVLLLILLILLGVSAASKNSKFENEVKEGQNYLRQYSVENGPPDLLDKVEEELKRIRTTFPDEARNQTIQQLENDLNAARSREQKRVDDLEKAIQPLEAENAAFNKKQYSQAMELARTGPEKERLRKIERRNQEMVNAQKDAERKVFESDLKIVVDELDQLANNPVSNIDEFKTAIERSLAKLEKIDPDNSDPELTAKKENLRAKGDQLATQAALRAEMSGYQTELKSAVGNPRQYQVAVENVLSLLREKYSPSSGKKSDSEETDNSDNAETETQAGDSSTPEELANLQRVRAEFDLRKKVLQWNEFSHTQEKSYMQLGNTRTGYDDFRRSLDGLTGSLGDFPGTALINEVAESYKNLSGKGGRQAINAALDKLFREETPLWSFCLKKDGQETWFYFTGSESDKKVYRQKGEAAVISPLTDGEMKQLVAAPHRKAVANSDTLVQELLDRPNDFSGEKWYEMMEQVLRNFDPSDQDGMDPLIKYVYLRKILEPARLDPLIDECFADWIERLNLNGNGSTFEEDWSNYEDKNVAQARKDVAALLAELPNMDGITPKLWEKVQTRNAPILSEYQWVGFLWKTGSSWSCIFSDSVQKEFSPADNNSGEQELLYICRAGSTENIPRLLEIGTLRNGKTELLSAEADFLYGLPVYLRTIRKPKDFFNENI